MLTSRPAAVAPPETTLVLERPRSLARTMRTITFGLLLVFVFTIPSTSAIVISPSLGTISRLIGVALVPPAALALLVGGSHSRLHDVHIVMGVLVLWAGLSWYWSIETTMTAALTDTAIQLLILVYVVWEFGSDHGRWEHLLWAYVLGCYLGALQVIGAALTGNTLGPSESRFTAIDFKPGDLASILVLGIPGAWYLGIRASSRLARAVARLYVPVGIMAIVLTASRASVFALAVAIAVIPLTIGWLHMSARVAFFIATVGVGIAALRIVPADTIARLLTISSELESGTLNGRIPLWSSTVDIIEQQPFLGVGAGALRQEIDLRHGVSQGAHNTYLAIGGELGVIGLALFLLVLIVAGLQALRYSRLERAFATTTLAALLVTMIPLHSHYAKSTWLVIALVIAPAARWYRRPGIGPPTAGSG